MAISKFLRLIIKKKRRTWPLGVTVWEIFLIMLLKNEFKIETVEEFLARGGKIQYINVRLEPTPTFIARSKDPNYEILDLSEEWRFNYSPPSRWIGDVQ